LSSIENLVEEEAVLKFVRCTMRKSAKKCVEYGWFSTGRELDV